LALGAARWVAPPTCAAPVPIRAPVAATALNFARAIRIDIVSGFQSRDLQARQRDERRRDNRVNPVC
jgi:hypothetical protein